MLKTSHTHRWRAAGVTFLAALRGHTNRCDVSTRQSDLWLLSAAFKPQAGRGRDGQDYRRQQAIWSTAGHVLLSERDTLRHPNHSSLSHTHTQDRCVEDVSQVHTLALENNVDQPLTNNTVLMISKIIYRHKTAQQLHWWPHRLRLHVETLITFCPH